MDLHLNSAEVFTQKISDAPDLGPFSTKFLIDISCMQGKTLLLALEVVSLKTQ